MLFREIIAVYCENHTELCGQNIRIQFVLHRKHITSPLQNPTMLMLFREIIAVYCENHMEHINTLCGQNGRILILRQVVYIVTAVP
jgi:hypothetical protein